MKPVLIYCFDAYCEWCYAFAPVMQKIAKQFSPVFDIELLSGGLLLPEKPRHISAIAAQLLSTYQHVEETSGVRFGRDFLWHVENPGESDWYPDSLKSAVALAIFREEYPDNQVEFATDLEYALFFEGRDLCDDEAYRHLLKKYQLAEAEFFLKLHSDAYELEAKEDFQTVRQLGIEGYPALLVQTNPDKIIQLTAGYMSFAEVEAKLQKLL